MALFQEYFFRFYKWRVREIEIQQDAVLNR